MAGHGQVPSHLRISEVASRGRRIVIVGISGHWGAEVASELVRRPEIEQIIGIDMVRPTEPVIGTEFVEADIRNPEISRILPALEPDLVVHCGIVTYPEQGRPSRALHDINVIGTLQLLAACDKVPGLEAVVIRGSSAIYGSSAGAPSFFSEEMAGHYPLATRFQRDMAELEGYVESFARRRPDVICNMLRFQVELGPSLDNPLTRYLRLPVVPTRFGFDPRLQLLHEKDATGALTAAILDPVRGPVNVAPDGAISLSRLLRLCGKSAVGLPSPLLGLFDRKLGNLLGSADQYRDGELLLRYGRGCDNTRLRDEVGYELAFDTEGTVRDFAGGASGLVPALFPSPHPGAPVRSVRR